MDLIFINLMIINMRLSGFRVKKKIEFSLVYSFFSSA